MTATHTLPPPVENHESFRNRLRLRYTPDQIELIDLAYDHAKYSHRNQIRDDGKTRVFEHARRVTLVIIDEFGITDIDIVIGGILHDTIEDAFLLTVRRIQLVFGGRAGRITDAVTKRKRESVEEYVRRLRLEEIAASIVKWADRIDNLRTLSAWSRKRQERKIKETRDLYWPLIGDIREVYPTLADTIEWLANEAISALGF
ncbi:MAG: pyrophosphokinae [Parcubacteria group bacterium]|nr:pyrophosphokinae [Parcubacteria group bacterium]